MFFENIYLAKNHQKHSSSKRIIQFFQKPYFSGRLLSWLSSFIFF